MKSSKAAEGKDNSSQGTTQTAEVSSLKAEDLHRALLVLTVVAALLSCLRGFRWPNLWGATQFAFNYSQGFVRRGLVGEVARTLFGDKVFQYNHFVAFAFILFALNVSAFVVLLKKSLRAAPTDLGVKILVLVLAASPSLVVLTHLIGYLDFVGSFFTLIFASLVIRAKGPFLPLVCSTLLGVALVFVHEVLNVLFMPAIAFMTACHILRQEQIGASRKQLILLWSWAVVATVLPFVLSAVVSMRAEGDAPTVRALQHWMYKNVDFRVRPGAFGALQRSAYENMTQLMPRHWAKPADLKIAQKTIFTAAPALLFVLVAAFRMIRNRVIEARRRWLLVALLLGAWAAPLTLHAVGWDSIRWVAFSLLSCVLCGLTCRAVFAEGPDEGSAGFLTLGAAVTLVGLCSSLQLFDRAPVIFFPFEEHYDFILQLIERDTPFRPRS